MTPIRIVDSQLFPPVEGVEIQVQDPNTGRRARVLVSRKALENLDRDAGGDLLGSFERHRALVQAAINQYFDEIRDGERLVLTSRMLGQLRRHPTG